MRDRGIEATARIVDTGQRSPSIALAWYDRTGVERHYRLIHVSDNFWHRISVGKSLVVPEVKIRYLEDNSWARPVIVDDSVEREFSGRLAIVFGAILLVISFAFATAFTRRLRAWSQARAAEHN
jgi:hypothetical protein